ncbi:MAG: hypothetical protein ACTS3T_17030 [Almyronema sp.]
MTAIARYMVCLFLPASLGLVAKAFVAELISERVLALALLLLSVEQARMAVVDLEQIAAVSQKAKPPPRLQWFRQVTLITIALELLGFYIAWVNLGIGTLLVLLSQIGFNLLAGIQIDLTQPVMLQPYGIRQRWLVLMADSIGLLLVSLWCFEIAPLETALALFVMVCGYGVFKYGSLFLPH